MAAFITAVGGVLATVLSYRSKGKEKERDCQERLLALMEHELEESRR